MNIEQIAHVVSSEMSKEAKAMEGRAMMTEFLRRCLAKIAEQAGEPFIYAYRYNSAFGSTVISCTRSTADAIEAIPLYTSHQLTAAQQRTAEACAKAVERLIGGDGLCADDGVWIHDCAEAIRNGDWREYL